MYITILVSDLNKQSVSNSLVEKYHVHFELLGFTIDANDLSTALYICTNCNFVELKKASHVNLCICLPNHV